MTTWDIFYKNRRKKLIFWGSGEFSKKLITLLEESPTYYIDSFQQNLDEQVFLPEKLMGESKNELFIVVASFAYIEISNTLTNMGFEMNKHFINGIELFHHFPKVCYSQNGEDVIVSNLLSSIGVTNPTYLDIGANHPTVMNNTYYFYIRGNYGVCIEPDTQFNNMYAEQRPNQILINKVVGREEGKVFFYKMNESGLNTANSEQVENYKHINDTLKLNQKIEVEATTYNSIVMKYFNGVAPDFVSLDVETYEETILRAIDFEKYAPIILSVETIIYKSNKKNERVIKYLLERGYEIGADTFINTIFVKKGLLKEFF